MVEISDGTSDGGGERYEVRPQRHALAKAQSQHQNGGEEHRGRAGNGDGGEQVFGFCQQEQHPAEHKYGHRDAPVNHAAGADFHLVNRQSCGRGEGGIKRAHRGNQQRGHDQEVDERAEHFLPSAEQLAVYQFRADNAGLNAEQREAKNA